MAIRSYAAPPTPWSRSLAEPKINATAYVHSSSNLIGDVRVGANVLIAPGTSIRADEGSPFHIGENTNLQDGVVVHGLEQGRVVGDDRESYSVWIGDHTSITHMALIHGPAYVGDDCFIGFRSTVFNARVGEGCIVMMHALIQDVEIPPGRYVPSGAIITTQHQADRLPKVQEVDQEFAAHVIGINDSLRMGYRCAEDLVCITPIKQGQDVPGHQSAADGRVIERSTDRSMNGEVINHIRQLLAQGYRIGTEHANKRQFQTSAWKSCAPIQATTESTVLTELDTCLANHQGEYVRLIGIDPKAKRRVLEAIIQRPGETPAQLANGAANHGRSAAYSTSNGSSNGYGSHSASHQGLDATVVAQIRQILSKGGRIGTEHANKRQFQTSAWKSCAPIQATHESAVITALEACMTEHTGEYVRLIGIDPSAKRRILETIIQRPDGRVVSSSATVATFSNGTASQPAGSAIAAGDITTQINQLITQGATLALEFADERRFRTSSWYSAPAIQASSASQAIGVLESFLAEHPRDYVRLVGVDPKAKKRILETIVQRPGQSGAGVSSQSETSSASYGAARSATNGNATSGHLSADAINQIRQFITQGYRIGIEYADQRRYRTSSWQTATTIQAHRDAEAIAQIESTVAEYPGTYVRLIGIDPSAKRRVAEVLVQQPG